MSGIVLSSSVRQNLLSLQSTADLLATTQSRLSTGKKVNTALDNPTNFFTAQALDSRASDISNLLDGIGNGVQILQAANTGITSLQKLVDTAKSIANQALQTTVGYSTKSNVSTTIAGATATDLRGTTTYTSATASSNVLFSGAAGGTTAATRKYAGRPRRHADRLGVRRQRQPGTPRLSPRTRYATRCRGIAGRPPVQPHFTDGSSTVNGHTVTFKAGAAPSTASVPTGYGVSPATSPTMATATRSSISARAQTTRPRPSATSSALSTSPAALSRRRSPRARRPSRPTPARPFPTSRRRRDQPETSTGGDSARRQGRLHQVARIDHRHGSGIATVAATRVASAGTLGTLIQDGSTLNVDGKTITFKNAGTPATANVPADPASTATSSPTAR